MRTLSLVTGIFAFLNGVFLCAFSNFNLGIVLTILFGLFFIFIGIFYEKIKKFTKTGILKYIKIAVIVLICSEIVFCGFLFAYGNTDNVTYTEDAVIVLGAAVHGDIVSLPLRERLDAALKYYNKNPNAVIIVSGGQGQGETVTEASAMEKYLIAAGVNPEKIIKEEKAESTAENMRFSKRIADGLFGTDYNTVIITNDFHIYRSILIAKKEGLTEISHFHAKLKWYNVLSCYLRESLAVIKELVL